MKKYDKRMLFKIALGAGVLSLGVFVHSLIRRDPLLNEPLSKGAGSICFDYGLIGEIPTYKIEVPAPRLRMNESRAKGPEDADDTSLYAGNEGLDTLSPTEE